MQTINSSSERYSNIFFAVTTTHLLAHLCLDSFILLEAAGKMQIITHIFNGFWKVLYFYIWKNIFKAGADYYDAFYPSDFWNWIKITKYVAIAPEIWKWWNEIELILFFEGRTKKKQTDVRICRSIEHIPQAVK